MSESTKVKLPKEERDHVKATKLVPQETAEKQWDLPRHQDSKGVNCKWSSTMDGVQNIGGIYVMNFQVVKVAEKNSKGQSVYREMRMTHNEAAQYRVQKIQEEREPLSEAPAKVKRSETQPTEKVPVQKNLLDKVLEYIGGSVAFQFFKGIGAGILEWFAGIISGIGALLKAAFTGNIAAIAAIGGLAVIAILACFFPEVVLPVLMVIGGIAGFLSGGVNLIKMMNPFISAYEKGEYLGNAIVDGLLLIISVAEIVRFVKVYAQVAKLAAGASLMEQLSFIKTVKGIKDISKIAALLANSNDITKTVRLLDKVKDIDKVINLTSLEKDQGKLLTLLEEKGVTGEQLLETLNPKSFKGLTYYESVGGHTILKHVGKTDADLIMRLKTEPKIRGSSSLTDLAIAERVVTRTVGKSSAEIAAWLKSGAKFNLPLPFQGGDVLGRGIIRGQNAVANMFNAVTVLKSDGRSGYYVLTAYPE